MQQLTTWASGLQQLTNGLPVTAKGVQNLIYNTDSDANFQGCVIVTSLPATGDFNGQLVFDESTDVLYQWSASSNSWVATGPNNLNQLAGQITTTQIAPGAVTTPKLAAGSVTASVIAASTIVAANIQAGTITGAQIAGGTITGENISGGTITGANIASATITGANISGGTITGANLVNATITGGKIGGQTIGSTNMALGAVSSAQQYAVPTTTIGISQTVTLIEGSFTGAYTTLIDVRLQLNSLTGIEALYLEVDLYIDGVLYDSCGVKLFGSGSAGFWLSGNLMAYISDPSEGTHQFKITATNPDTNNGMYVTIPLMTVLRLLS